MNQPESGNRTEAATPRKLRAARKRGEVPKSRELTATLLLAFLLVQIAWLADYMAGRLAAFTLSTIEWQNAAFRLQLSRLGEQAIWMTLSLSALLLLPAAAFALLVEFLQTGPVFALSRLTPRLSHIDPIAGLKRLFGIDNMVEVVMSIVKTMALLLIGAWLIRTLLDVLVPLLHGSPRTVLDAFHSLLIRLCGWTLLVFALLMVLDVAYQRKRFASRMKMSVRDIRREHKDSEGDPMLKSHRRQLHLEYAEQQATAAVGQSAVLVVNPHHIAVAIAYHRHHQPVPRVLAIGEDQLAIAMREAAHRQQVPVLRNEGLARTLHERLDAGDLVPRELFDIVAEVIHWALRSHAELSRQGDRATTGPAAPSPPVPGEDLSDYPFGAPHAQEQADTP